MLATGKIHYEVGANTNAMNFGGMGPYLIPDPTSAGDFCRRFEKADALDLMEAIHAVRPQLWRGRGRDLLGPATYLDVDGTLAPTYGKLKAGMDISYKGIWG